MHRKQGRHLLLPSHLSPRAYPLYILTFVALFFQNRGRRVVTLALLVHIVSTLSSCSSARRENLVLLLSVTCPPRGYFCRFMHGKHTIRVVASPITSTTTCTRSVSYVAAFGPPRSYFYYVLHRKHSLYMVTSIQSSAAILPSTCLLLAVLLPISSPCFSHFLATQRCTSLVVSHLGDGRPLRLFLVYVEGWLSRSFLSANEVSLLAASWPRRGAPLRLLPFC
jgi:hypothetical protein